MEKQAVVNILVFTGTEARAEQVINLLRRSGLSIRAQQTDTAGQLPELLGIQLWDLLLIIDRDIASVRTAVDAVHNNDRDIPAILLLSDETAGDLPALYTAGVRDIIILNDPSDSRQLVRLQHCVRRELSNLQDRRDRRWATTTLRELDQRYQQLLNGAADAIAYLLEGVHIYVNSAYAELFGYQSIEQLVNIPVLDLVAAEDQAAVKQFLRDPAAIHKSSCSFVGLGNDGSRFNAVIEGAVVPYEGERALQILIRHATGNTAVKNTLRQIHKTDLVSGLLNRGSLLSRIDHAITDAVYDQKSNTLLLLQLQHVEEATIVMGRSAINLLYADIGNMLQKLLASDIESGRLGSNEFALLIPDAPERDSQWELKLLETINKNLLELVPATLQLSVLAGRATVSADASDGEVIVERARYNIYVKQNKESLFGDLAAGTGVNREEVLATLHKALDRDNFVLAFQPIVSFKPDGMEHYELRIRIRSNGEGNAELIYPTTFLEVANQTGLGEEIDRWVLLQTLTLLQQHNNPDLRFTVNLTPNSVSGNTLLPWLVEQIRTFRLPTEQLILQISELDIISSPDKAVAFSNKLRELDIRLAVAHFGCSLDPFRYLALVHAYIVKLDRALVQHLNDDPKQWDKLNNTVKSLHSHGLLVIAPMIDQMGLLPALWQADINMVQGNCLQAPSGSMNFAFTQEEEITLHSFNP